MSSSSPAKGRILLGDDVRQISFPMRQTLEQAGYDVAQSIKGDRLPRTSGTQPDLVIVGELESVKALRAEGAGAQIGVMICASKAIDPAESMALGVNETLVEPFAPEFFLKKVEAFFDHRAQNLAAADKAASSFAPKFDALGNRYTLWGTRGSTPTPGARFLRHGGNTSCFCVTYGDETFIFDAGSGIRELGAELMRSKRRKLHLLVTHTHWDHIQGFPFFTPAYVPGSEITIWGAELFGKDLRSVFGGQLGRDYFPVQMEDMTSTLQFQHLDSNPIRIGDVEVWWEYSQHPGATVGYKINLNGFKIGWVPDNEFLQGYTGDPALITRDHPLLAPYRKMVQFLSDVDVLVHEAQYTAEEYPSKVGWGHSNLVNACILMKLAGVRRWIITHHDPAHDDDFLEKKLAMTQQVLSYLGHECQVSNGYDGMTEYLPVFP